MNKVIENGFVAVLYSPGYGAGWSTWNYEDGLDETLLFHPALVEMVRNNRQNEIDTDWLVKNLGEEFRNVYCGGAMGLEIEWLPEGTIFRVEEYDGSESIVIISDKTTYKA